MSDNVNVEFLQITQNFEMELMVDGHKLLANLIGKHQIQNIRTAIIAAMFLSKQFPNIEMHSILKGIQNVQSNTGFHFRIERVSKNPPVVIDISHNPQGVAMLADTIKSANKGK